MAEPRRPQPARPSPPLRVTSLNPVRDAKTIGHEVGTTRTAIEAKRTALQARYRKLIADAEAEDEGDRELRLETLLVHVAWACDAIADDLATLKAMHDAPAHRDKLIASVSDEVIVLAELSSDDDDSTTWEEALAALHALAKDLIRNDERSAAQLSELDVVLERIDHAEGLANDAVRNYLRYTAITH
jgi:hypothetical protein